MIPSRLTVRLALLWAALGGLAAVLDAQGLWGWASLGVCTLLGLDALRGWRLPLLVLRRRMPGIWAQGRVGEVMLELENPGTRALRLGLYDQHPAQWQALGIPERLEVPAKSVLVQPCRYLPPARGGAQFLPARLEVDSPWCLWCRRVQAGVTESVKVYPDIVPLLGHGLAGAADSRHPIGGQLRTRQRGEGTEFHQLREYRRGDSLRRIDWKATSRLGKPISREFRVEQDQQVVFLLDCGRRMLSTEGDKSHFEHALEAMLRLAWTAGRQNDAVAVQTFAGTDLWLPPRKGMPGFEALLSGVHDLQPTPAAPDFLLASRSLVRRLRRRSLVVILTNLRDEDDDGLRAAVGLLSARHLVICASLRESLLDDMAHAPVTDLHAALSVSAARLLRQDRGRLRARSGLPAASFLDVPPRELPLRLVDRYLEIKGSGRL